MHKWMIVGYRKDEGIWKNGNERNSGKDWGGMYFPEGRRRTAGREAEGGDELMINHHMVP